MGMILKCILVLRYLKSDHQPWSRREEAGNYAHLFSCRINNPQSVYQLEVAAPVRSQP